VSAVSSSSSFIDRFERLPGVALAVAVTAGAFALHRLPGLSVLSPMILAILLGMAVNNLAEVPARCGPGLAWSMRPLLRAGIVLLGLQITPAKLVALGFAGFAVVALTLVATFFVTVWIGRRLGLRNELADLIAAGSSICGASAVIAMNGVSNGSREDVAHAVATVTLFGTLSMFLFPVLGDLLHLAPHAYGLWTGAAIHEIAQVVAAGFQGGTEAGEFATVAKLARVMLLAPLVIGLGAWRARGRATAGTTPAPFPWFVLGFLALVGFGGLVDIGPTATAVSAQVTTLLLTTALGAMGLSVDLRRLASEGWRPLATGAASWLFVSGFSLLWVEVLAREIP